MAWIVSIGLILLHLLLDILLIIFYTLVFIGILLLSSFKEIGIRTYQVADGVLTALNDFLLLLIDQLDVLYDIGYGVGTVLSVIPGVPLRLLKMTGRALPFLVLLIGFLVLMGITILGLAFATKQSEVMVGFDDAWCSTRDNFDSVFDYLTVYIGLMESFGIHIINLLLFLDPRVLVIRTTLGILTIPQKIDDADLFASLQANENFLAFASFLFEGIGYLAEFFFTVPHNGENCYSLADEPQGGECAVGDFNEGEPCEDSGDCDGTCSGGADDGDKCQTNPDCDGVGVCVGLRTCVLLPVITVTVPLTCKLSESPDNINCIYDPTECPALQEGECFSGPDTGSPCSLDSECDNVCPGGVNAGLPCTQTTVAEDCPDVLVCTEGQCSTSHTCPDDLFLCWLQRIFNIFLVPICNFARSLVEDNRIFALIFNVINTIIPQLLCILGQFLQEVIGQFLIDLIFDGINFAIDSVNRVACFSKKVLCFAVCSSPCSGLPPLSCGGTCSGLGCPGFCSSFPAPFPLVSVPITQYPDSACDQFSTDPGEDCLSSSECGSGTCKVGSCGSGANQGFGCDIATAAADCGVGVVCNERKCRDGPFATLNDGCISDFDCGGLAGSCRVGRPCNDVTLGLLSSCPISSDNAHLFMQNSAAMAADFRVRTGTVSDAAMNHRAPPTPSVDFDTTLYRRPNVQSSLVRSDYTEETVGEQIESGNLDPTFPNAVCRDMIKVGNPRDSNDPDDDGVSTGAEHEYQRCVAIYAGYILIQDDKAQHPRMAADAIVGDGQDPQDSIDIFSDVIDEIVLQNVSLPIEDRCKLILDHPLDKGESFAEPQYKRCMILYMGSYYLSQYTNGYTSPSLLTYLDYSNQYVSQTFDFIFTLVNWKNDTMVPGLNGGPFYNWMMHGWNWVDTELDSAVFPTPTAADMYQYPEPRLATPDPSEFVSRSPLVSSKQEKRVWPDNPDDMTEEDLRDWPTHPDNTANKPYPSYNPHPGMTPEQVRHIKNSPPKLGARVTLSVNGPRTFDVTATVKSVFETIIDAFCDTIFFGACTPPVDMDDIINATGQFIVDIIRLIVPDGGLRIPDCEYNPITARDGLWTFPGCALRIYLPNDLPNPPQLINGELIPWPLDCIDGTVGCTGNQCSTISQLCDGGPDVGLPCFISTDCEGLTNFCTRQGTCSDTGGLEFFPNCGSTVHCSECSKKCVNLAGVAGIDCIRDANCPGIEKCAKKRCDSGVDLGKECFVDAQCAGFPFGPECTDAGTCFSNGKSCSNDLECDSAESTCLEYEKCADPDIGFIDGFDNAVWTIEAVCPPCMELLRSDPIIRSLPFGLGTFAGELLDRFDGTHTTDPKTVFCYFFTWAYIVLPGFLIVIFYVSYVIVGVTLLINFLLGLWLLVRIISRVFRFIAFAIRRIRIERLKDFKEDTAEKAQKMRADMDRLMQKGPPQIPAQPSAPPPDIAGEEREPLPEANDSSSVTPERGVGAGVGAGVGLGVGAPIRFVADTLSSRNRMTDNEGWEKNKDN